MSLRVTNPTDSPHLSRRLVEQANNSLHTRNGGGERRSCRGVISDAKVLPLWRASLAGTQMKALLWSVSAVMYPAFVRAPLRAFSCALRQLALLLRLRRPAGYGFPPNLVRKDRRKDFSGASVNAELRHLGAWPTRLMVPRPRSGDSTNGDNHVPEQSNPHRLPRQQRRSPHQQPGLQRHHAFAGNQVLLQEGWQVHLAHRMASLRSLRQALGVRQDARQRRAYPGGRRTAQSGVREQEDGLRSE